MGTFDMAKISVNYLSIDSDYMGLDARKPVFGVSVKASFLSYRD